jgi:ABC-2 type transport system ATP-binding protein
MIEGLKELGKTVFLTTHYMDEAQHLADRVAILRGGEIVAHGRTEELGSSLGASTMVRFRAPAAADLAALREELGLELEESGGTAGFRTEDVQRDLYRLLGWAERRGVELEALEATRPSLEDVFLEVTREETPG